jgi:hypothetical protein
VEFRLVRVSSPDHSVSLDVPQDFFGYEASDHLAIVKNSETEEHLIFGHLTVNSSLYLEVGTGRIFAGIDPDHLIFVNSSLGDFAECVREMITRFPYYDEDSDFDEWARAAEDVERAIAAIDPPATAGDAFWNEFRWEVATGDYYDE